jgi:4-hydroxy-3-methylbut-2-enyl diphosphate reductase
MDNDAGFCFGVEKAIQLAEKELAASGILYCLGELVHNTAELDRLKAKGLRIVSHEEAKKLEGQNVLIRAHGEPPDTYTELDESGIGVIDATCPIVIRLQGKISEVFKDEGQKQVQIVIFGKSGHPEVVGLLGHTNNTAIVVNSADDLEKIDLTLPVRLFSQTTMSAESYARISELISQKMHAKGNCDLVIHKSFCRQVSGRSASIREFAGSHDVIIFVSDKKSSNGVFLYNLCRSVNPDSYFVHDRSEIDEAWFENAESVGVTGATSTPRWLMESIMQAVEDCGNEER